MALEGRGAVTCCHARWAVTLTTAGARVPTVRRSNPDFLFCESVLLAGIGKRLTAFNIYIYIYIYIVELFNTKRNGIVVSSPASYL